MKTRPSFLIRFAMGFTVYVLLQTGAWARTPAEIEEAVRTEIASRHPTTRPDWWRALGPETPTLLMRLYGAETSIYSRLRLMEGLSAFDTDTAAVDFIKGQAEKTHEAAIRNNAIRVIGLSQGERGEEWLSKFLAHDDPHTRLAAANALRAVGTESAIAQVDRLAANEKTDWLATKLKKPWKKNKTTLLPPVAAQSAGAPTPVPSLIEETLSPEWAGNWSGFWVSPRTDKPQGMKSEPVRLSMTREANDKWTGVLNVGEGAKGRSLQLIQLQGKGIRGSATLSETQVGVDTKTYPCDADLSSRATTYLMRIALAQDGSSIILRRDPKAN